MNDDLGFIVFKPVSIPRVCALRLPVARVLLEATLLCYETNCKSHLRDYGFIVECILIVAIEPKFYNWYIYSF